MKNLLAFIFAWVQILWVYDDDFKFWPWSFNVDVVVVTTDQFTIRILQLYHFMYENYILNCVGKKKFGFTFFIF